MKFDRQLWPATETSWVVSYGRQTIPRWWTNAILKIDISPYLSEESSDFHEFLYTAADFELDERQVIKNGKVALDRLRVRQNVFLVVLKISLLHSVSVITNFVIPKRDKQTDKKHHTLSSTAGARPTIPNILGIVIEEDRTIFAPRSLF